MRRTRFLRQVFPPDIRDRVLLQRHAWIAALLRAVVHQPVFADVEVAGPGAAAPLVWSSLCNIVLERIDAREAALLHCLHGMVHRALFLIERLKLSIAVMNDPDGRTEPEFQ